jgi:hypothetical protein
MLRTWRLTSVYRPENSRIKGPFSTVRLKTENSALRTAVRTARTKPAKISKKPEPVP